MNKIVLATKTLAVASVMALAVGLAAPGQVRAVTCSGRGCNGKDPYSSGCAQSAVLISRKSFLDPASGIAVAYQTWLDTYYSRTCGTNWVRVSQNPFGGAAYKSIQVQPNGYWETEIDTTYGYSYSMMVYAPGSTPVMVAAKLFDRSNRPRALVEPYTIR